MKRIPLAILVVSLMTGLLAEAVPGQATSKRAAAAKKAKPEPEPVDGQSDLNRDGFVNLFDLQIFSQRWLKQSWQQVDWATWLDARDKTSRHMGKALTAFVAAVFGRGTPTTPNRLRVENEMRYPTRLAWGPDGRLYVSDVKVGSVFLLESVSGGFEVVGELKGFEKPLGVVVDHFGSIYVGNDGADCVEVYDATGWRTGTIGEGLIKMPTDMVVDINNRLFVADSVNNTVWVYDGRFEKLTNFGTSGSGSGRFNFPTSLAIDITPGAETLYVADQGNFMVQVFDLDGTFLRSFGEEVTQGMFSWNWRGKFEKLQSLFLDANGDLHAADIYMNNVQILDHVTGAYLTHYGVYGTDPGELFTLTDIAIDDQGRVAAANSGHGTVEIIHVVP